MKMEGKYTLILRCHASGVKTTEKVYKQGLPSLEGMAQVVLYNDDHNTFPHVIAALMTVFHHTIQIAMKLAVEAHKSGRTIAEVESKSEAIFHKEQLVSYGLTAEVEPI